MTYYFLQGGITRSERHQSRQAAEDASDEFFQRVRLSKVTLRVGNVGKRGSTIVKEYRLTH